MRVFEIVFEFDRYFRRVRDHLRLLIFPLGHEIGTKSVCGAENLCNPALLDEPGPNAGPRKPEDQVGVQNFQFSVNFLGGRRSGRSPVL